ncbi:hypothetical protein VOLCADRAFT_118257 [Volvox carteri f. nagariensis]|uniref:Uncharacterized protein n=1 Tax=Volvox carteri f. nagariensis TaxID=3068 RepID=D8U319_VOLCA|nr:uncharacterized protein VOLCADRAFT_118257 [Volvox carteri f. nagariensis]EFJ45902.1 hypothetical protein VOLCADRAFT_118257 [Volvox carteri f. nagariensis]|eukprot:XP_002952980.1 hypothetical protein VOLCADRAFT_118257 [Volvox carteri f. nagariensis]
MGIASRTAVDRMWRSMHKAGAAQRNCSVRVHVAAPTANSACETEKHCIHNHNVSVLRWLDVQVVAFNEGRRPLSGAPRTQIAKTSAGTGAGARPSPTVLLSADHVNTLSPAALAASLVEYAQKVAIHGSDNNGSAAAVPAGDPRMFNAVAQRLAQSVDDFDAISLVDVLHAYSRAGHGRNNRDVLAICCIALSGKVDELPPASLVRLAAACAALDLQATDLLAALCARADVPEVLSQLSAADLAALLVALSQLQHRSRSLYVDAAEVLAAELQAAVAARRGAAGRQAAGAASVLLMDRLGDLDGNALAKIAWSYATIRPADEGHRGLYLVSEAQSRPQFFGQVALLDIIRLISRVQHRDPEYYGPALQVLLEHVHKAFLDAPLEKSGCMNPFRFG